MSDWCPYKDRKRFTIELRFSSKEGNVPEGFYKEEFQISE